MRLSGAEVNLQLDPDGGIAGMPDFAAGATNADAGGAALPGACGWTAWCWSAAGRRWPMQTGETLLELSDINADAALESLASPLTLSARAVWQGTPLRFEGQVASLERFLRSQAVAVIGTLGFADATASLFGDLDLSTGEPAFWAGGSMPADPTSAMCSPGSAWCCRSHPGCRRSSKPG